MPRIIDSIKNAVKLPVHLFASWLGPHNFDTNESRLWILMYHRILPKQSPYYAGEEPGMIVTPDTFRQHLRILKQLFTVLPLSEWVTRLEQGQPLPPRACAVTFDDGWLDNFEYALPILLEEQVPATVFVVPQMIDTDRQFWPNRLSALLQKSTADQQKHATFSWLHQAPGFLNGSVFSREKIAAVIHWCKQLSDHDLHRHLDEMEQLGVAKKPISESVLMSWDQLRQMCATGLIEIGSHTCNHFRLGEALPDTIASREIADSQKNIEHELNRPINLFCYPNGEVSRSAAAMVKQHYAAAVTTQLGINTPATPLHLLTRIGVHDDISNTPIKFKARLSGWV